MNVAADVAVHMASIAKRFGGVHALREVDVSFYRNEIHALLGENGAGKSTILKILRGVLAPDSGSIAIGGESFQRLTPQLGRSLGIAMIFQEMSLVPALTVAQNIFLSEEPLSRVGLIDDEAMKHRTAVIFKAMGVKIDPGAIVGDLSTGQQQLTEIAKALSQEASILVLDEPTSALTSTEVETLFDLLGRLRSEGKAIVYVSHRMDEIFRIADRATVLRDGNLVSSRPIGEYSLTSLITDIMGKSTRDLSDFGTVAAAKGDLALSVESLSGKGHVGAATLSVHRGEVLGIAGLLGSGRSRLVRMLFGLEQATSGRILVGGEVVQINSPQDAIAAGLALVPEDRRKQGLVLSHSVQDNIETPNLHALGSGPFIDKRKSRKVADGLIASLAIRTSGRNSRVDALSGGNQQKVVIGKWLETKPSILILDEPTAGVDIGSKGEVLRLVRELAADGTAVLFISSELAELIAVSDRIAIMRDGEVVDVLTKLELLDVSAADGEELKAEQKLQFLIQKGARRE